MNAPARLSALVLHAVTFSLYGAARTNETFDSGANGWVGTTSFLTGNWAFSGGEAKISFADIGMFAFPDFGLLSNSPSATSGSFTGNYDAAGANVIGFSFYAADILPGGGSNVVLRWRGSTSVFQKAFTVAQTGVWYNFSMPLSDAARFEWDLFVGSYDDFPAARQAVSSVNIRVFRNGSAAHSFAIGEIYLSNEPESVTFAITGSNALVGAGGLLTGEAYDIESASEVSGTWSYAQSFVATNSQQIIQVTNTGDRLYWRLLGP